MNDTSVKVTTDGTYTRTIANCTDTFTQGEGTDIKSPHETTTNGGWTYFGSVDSKGHQLQLSMQALAAFNAGTWKRSGDCETFDKPLFLLFAMEDCIFDDKNQTTAFRIPMNDDFTVPEGDRGPCDVKPLIGEINDLTAHAKIHWVEMKPIFPPDPDTAR
jgi:hypothetical protein